MAKACFFDFYGVRVKVNADKDDLADKLIFDFKYFSSEPCVPSVSIEIFSAAPAPCPLRKRRPDMRRDNFLRYSYKDTCFVDYNGRASAIYDFKQEKGSIWGLEEWLVHEVAYLLIHSRVGELLDSKGLHRVHSLGLTMGDQAILLLLPQAAGKTTIGLALLGHNGIGLLSDDTPLINRKGKVLPFPARIGVTQDHKLDIPQEFLRSFRRQKYGNKTLVDIRYFADKVCRCDAPAKIILLGKRVEAEYSAVRKSSKIKAYRAFFINCVVGIGLPQIREYFIRFNLKDLYSKLCIAASRLSASHEIIRKSKIYAISLGSNRKKNEECLLEFLRREITHIFPEAE